MMSYTISEAKEEIDYLKYIRLDKHKCWQDGEKVSEIILKSCDDVTDLLLAFKNNYISEREIDLLSRHALGNASYKIYLPVLIMEKWSKKGR